MVGPAARDAIARAVLAATRALERGACLDALAQGAMTLLDAAYCLAYLASASGDDLECVAAAGGEGLGTLRLSLEILDAGLLGHLAPQGPGVIDDAEILFASGEDDPLLPPLGQALAVPIAPFGLLLAIAPQGRTFDAAAREAAGALAREAQPALDNLRAVEALRELAIRDDTADCFNRRHLDQSLNEEVERARRFSSRFALIFLDMDNLKEVNTRHGHAAGSRVLYEASVRIARSVRSIDRVFRYGGDEFVVLLPGTNLEGAREVAERVRRELDARPFDLPSGARVVLTCSAGVAAWPEHGPGGRSVIEAGDRAMRAIKESGKNAVGSAPLPPVR